MAGAAPEPSMAASPRTVARMSRSTIRNEPKEEGRDVRHHQPARRRAVTSRPLPSGSWPSSPASLAIGAIGIALGQGIKATPAAGVPADVQAALIAQRTGEKAALFPAGDPRMIQHEGELRDRAVANAPDEPGSSSSTGRAQDRAPRRARPSAHAARDRASLVPRPACPRPTTVASMYPGKAADDTVSAAHDRSRAG